MCSSGCSFVTVCCKYDALPGIGHGCGHNLIATSSIATFFGMEAAIKAFKLPGRIRLIDAGAFKDVDVAIIAHPFPAPLDATRLDGVAYGNCLAVNLFRVVFTGKAVHGTVSPWLGANALDAAALAYSAVGMLRQQTKPSDVIGLIIEEGGASSNIVSERAVINGHVRSRTLSDSVQLLERVHKCLEGAAIATGCSVAFDKMMEPFADLRSNETICSTFTEAMAGLGKAFLCDLNNIHNGPYSTDMGNVSYVCPAFHGKFHIETPPDAHGAAISVAKGMALTGWRILTEDDLAKKMREDSGNDKLRR
ncbi:bacterial exopeptidase dimerization domain-containing protein [Thozetella sp. PMI_491]|nr:bacterial exopeptidase dimerization domain-containing protein [Thozetella sp. PMI_491]